MSNGELIGATARSAFGRGINASRSRDVGVDMWITIQKNTFMNWINLQLMGSGYVVKDFETDLSDGLKICVLVENLQRRKVGKVSVFDYLILFFKSY